MFSGFYNRKGFILSQHPLDSTISSMWQMVAEQEIQVIIIIFISNFIIIIVLFPIHSDMYNKINNNR